MAVDLVAVAAGLAVVVAEGAVAGIAAAVVVAAVVAAAASANIRSCKKKTQAFTACVFWL